MSNLSPREPKRDVCLWHKADILIAWPNVRFRGKSGHRNLRASRPLLTHSGHQQAPEMAVTSLGIKTRGRRHAG